MSEFDDRTEGTTPEGVPEPSAFPPVEEDDTIIQFGGPAAGNASPYSTPEQSWDTLPTEEDSPAVEQPESLSSKAFGAAAAGAGALREGYEALKDVRRASREHSNARTHLAKIEEELEESRAELEHRTTVEANFDAIVSEQTAVIEEGTGERDEAQARIDELNAEKADLARQLEQMRQQHEQELRPYKELVDSSRSRADDANRSLSEARRAARSAENQVNDLTSRRDSRLSAANKAVDNANLRLAELRTNLQALQADPTTKPEAIEEVNATIMAETAHLRAAEEEVAEVTAEMKKAEAEGLATVRLHSGDPSIYGAIREQFDVLSDAGIEPIEAVGKPFDTNYHNAVMHVDDDSLGENTVAEEFQKGYTYRGTVVRHSMVKVAN